MKFIDRENELKLLGDHLSRPGAAMFVLYGRRRIGKTALLSRALETVPRAAYHVGTRSTMVEEVRRLCAAVSPAWNVPFLSAQPATTSQAFFTFLEGFRGEGVLALDEFPFLIESDRSLAGLLQSSWDKHLSKSKLKLFFCGSSVGIMEEAFLSRKSPLYGRRTGQLRLGPLPPWTLSKVFAGSQAEILEMYAVFGGVPGYLQRLDPGTDLWGNLKSRLLARGEPLYEEVPFLLREELREPRVYNTILATVAAGSRKFGEISSKSGQEKANLIKYLSVLIDLGLIEREVSITEHQPDKSRKGLYRIADPFVATWYSLVYPFRDQLERGHLDRDLEKEIRERLKMLLPRAVEPVLRDLFLAGPLAAEVPFRPAFAGRQWSERGEFDIVILDQARAHAMAVELKWSSGKVGRHLLDDLRARVAQEKSLEGCACTYALVSRSGFTGRRTLARDERLIDVSRLRW